MLENVKNCIVSDADLLFVIQRELDIISDFCRDDKPTHIPPILQVVDSTNTQQLIPLHDESNFNRLGERRQILRKVGADFYQYWGRQIFPTIVMLTSEAWIKSFNSQEVPNPMRQPSDYPDAIDAIVVQAMTLTKSSALETQETVRAGMAVLEIKERDPYLQVEKMVEPNVAPANRQNTDLLNHFYMGWLQQGMAEQS